MGWRKVPVEGFQQGENIWFVGRGGPVGMDVGRPPGDGIRLHRAEGRGAGLGGQLLLVVREQELLVGGEGLQRDPGSC